MALFSRLRAHIIILLALATVIGSKVVIEMEWLQYTPTEYLFTGDCCKERIRDEGKCPGTCKAFFHICTKLNSSRPCSTVFNTQNLNNNTFKMLLHRPYKNNFEVKIEVRSLDKYKPNALIDRYHKNIWLTAGKNASSNAIYVLFVGAKTSLVMWLKVYCAENYYSSDCSVFCKEKNDVLGHYTCDPTTGEKICNYKWGGGSCTEDLNPCYSYPCMNGGKCVNFAPSMYRCTCKFGFEGERCGTVLDPCSNNLHLHPTRLNVRGNRKSRVHVTIDKAWYRISGTQFGQLTTSCKSVLSCRARARSRYPIYMIGSPSELINAVVTRNVCVTANNDCCFLKMNIKVKTCKKGKTLYYVYRLRKPILPSMNYCLK